MFIEKTVYLKSGIIDIKCRNNVLYRMYFRPSIFKSEPKVFVYIGGRLYEQICYDDLTIKDEVEKKSGYTSEELFVDYITMNGV